MIDVLTQTEPQEQYRLSPLPTARLPARRGPVAAVLWVENALLEMVRFEGVSSTRLRLFRSSCIWSTYGSAGA